MKKKWEFSEVKRSKERIFPELEKITEEILIKKGFKNEQEVEAFFTPDYDDNLHDPFLFNDMNKAVNRTLKASKEKEKVCVFGDYDADGVTSSVVVSDFLKKELGIENFCYIPDRETEGYALNKNAIDYIKKQGAKLIITVDCGITNSEEVAYAKKNKLDVIILDHHNVLNEIPKALAVIDPKNPAEKKYPFKELAGVGVAFKFLQGLSTKIKKFNPEQLKWYLDLVAVGTIADCVPLLDENRTLTKFGLMVLAKTRRVGFRQLFQTGHIKIGESDLPSSQQIAFQVAPRINAAGRMKHANSAFNLLMEENEEKASILAQEIEVQNKERQKVTADLLKKVKKEIDLLDKIPAVIIMSSEDWKLGIVGLCAGRLVEEYARPVILLQEKNGICKGSGRSIPGFSLTEALKAQESLLEKYGGHDQAAGLTLKKENLEKLIEKFIKESRDKIPKNIVKSIKIEAKVQSRDINKKLCEELSMLEPFGYNNTLPNLLLENVTIKDKKLLGNGEKHLKLWLGDNQGEVFEAIGFSLGEKSNHINIRDEIDLVFNLEKNNWNGSESLQLKIIDYKKSK